MTLRYGSPFLIRRPCRHFLDALLFLVLTTRAHAAATEACHPKDTDFVCHLRSLLALLDAAAWILGIVLALAVLLAVRAFRSRGRKRMPKEAGPDE